MPEALLATKLHIPAPRPKAVPRPRLMERLNEGLQHKLTLISAPAGFGKTTLVSEWIAGSRHTAALLTTGGAPQADKKTGGMPTEEELAKWQRVRPVMNELLQAKGMQKIAEEKVLVTGLKGPLETGWQEKVEAFAARILTG